MLLKNVEDSFAKFFPNKFSKDKYNVSNKKYTISNGDIVIAAITSCTNTSNPSVIIAAGLLAKKACELGLKIKPWVKTSFAPGSKIVTEYLKESGLDYYLDKIGFNLVGYGCTTCIGNSGPIDSDIENTINNNDIITSSVLSGNRNFEGRIHRAVKANYLMSPPLVVAYSFIGNIDIDISKDVIAKDSEGRDIYLKDIWPSDSQIQEYVNEYVNREMFAKKYKDVFLGDASWQNIKVTKTELYNWNENSTYINNPPYFEKIKDKKTALEPIIDANILAVFGDSITTDHISPAGDIAKDSPAAKYLSKKSVKEVDFNS
ncbi:MAG: aconitate hydratase, partial [Sphingobacteriales bacterium]